MWFPWILAWKITAHMRGYSPWCSPKATVPVPEAHSSVLDTGISRPKSSFTVDSKLADTLFWHTIPSLLVLTLSLLLLMAPSLHFGKHCPQQSPFISTHTITLGPIYHPRRQYSSGFSCWQKEFVQYFVLQWNIPYKMCIIACIDNV